MSSEFGDLALLVSLSAALGVIAVLFQVLAAMLNRPGPIRVRHWAEEAGGSLEQLYTAPARFEAFRYLLSFLAKSLPIALVVSGQALARGAGVGEPAATGWSVGIVLAVLLATEGFNRSFVGSSAERLGSTGTDEFALPVVSVIVGVCIVITVFVVVFAGCSAAGLTEEGEVGRTGHVHRSEGCTDEGGPGDEPPEHPELPHVRWGGSRARG